MDVTSIISATLTLLFASYILRLLIKDKPKLLLILLIVSGILIFVSNDYEVFDFKFVLINSGIPLLLVIIFWLVVLRNELFVSRKIFTKRKKYKLYNKIFTTKFYKFLSLIFLLIFSILIILVMLFAKNLSSYYTLIILTSILLVGSIYFLITSFLQNNDVAIIIIGKSKLSIYQNKNPFRTWIIENKSLINNDNFIVEPVGIINIKSQRINYYIYWIKTDMNVELNDSDVKTFNNFDLNMFITYFDKYQYHRFIVDNSKDLTIIKHERLK